MRALLGRATAQFGLVMWTLLALVPFVLILQLSLRNNADIYNEPLKLGGELQFDNYRDAWQGADGATGMAALFLNSTIIAIVAILVNLSVGTTAAYFASRLSVTARHRVVGVFILATVLPLVLMLVPYFQAFNALRILNQPAAVGVVYAALALPTTVLLLVSYFVDFPDELIEAAAIDGLGQWRTFLRIVLPLSGGAITAVSMLLLIFVWGETQLGVVLLQTPEKQSVPVGLLSFQGQWTTDLGAMFAGLAIASIPVMLAYALFHKRITKGIALGGVFR